MCWPPATSLAAAVARRMMRACRRERIMHSRIAAVSSMALLLCASCGDAGTAGAVETSTRALGTSVTFEAEALTRTASGTGSQVTAEAGASGGQYVQLGGTPAAGGWIEFTLPNVAPGTYDVKVLYKANFNRGIVQASIDGA